MERHSRWVRAWGGRVQVQPTDIAYLDALYRHGDLPADFLHALVRPDASQKVTARRLMQLYRRPNALVDRPPQQRQSYDANHTYLTYSISRRGLQVLREADGISGNAWVRNGRIRGGGQYHHRRMVSIASALIEIGLKSLPHIRYIPWREILDNAPLAAKRAADPFKIPVTVTYRCSRTGNAKRVKTAVVPDNVFGLEYGIGGMRLYRFFALEADRSVEIARADLRQSSHLKKFLGYREILAKETYRTQLNLPNLMVLSLFTKRRRMARSMELLKTITNGRGSTAFLFQTLADLGDFGETPKPTARLITDPWLRVGHEPFHLTNV